MSRAYLQTYTSYGYEILWVDRSYQGGVQCTWTSTLACLIFELLPFLFFFFFHAWILSGAYLQNYTSYGGEIMWVDRSHQGGVQCTWTITLACLIFELLPFVFFMLEFCPVHIFKNILAMVVKFWGWIDLIKGEVQCTWTLTLACLSFELLTFVYFHTWFLSWAYLQNYTCSSYEILWVDRSHQGGVQCTWTLACLIFELLPFVFCFFHTWCPEHISKTIY